MARKLKSDRVLFTTILFLVCVSVVMVYSASATLADERFQQPYFFLGKQVLWIVLGLAILSIAMRVDYRRYRNNTVVWAMLGLTTLMLVVVLFRAPVNNASRWIGLGGFGIQPSELAKLACILFTALTLERRMDKINEIPYSLLPIGIVVGIISTLIFFQPDFGTLISLVLVVAVMVVAAGLQWRYIVGGFVVLVPTTYFLLMSAPYRRARITAFLDPWGDQFGDGFQLIQSFIAVGTGGVFGRGLMAGVQKLFYLPQPHTDFIYAVIAEELGLIGATVILICFLVIAWRGLRIAIRSPDRFASFVALGVTAMITLQAFINMSVTLGLLPTKGIPLPLISAGGSSLLVTLLGLGILLNISQHETTEG